MHLHIHLINLLNLSYRLICYIIFFFLLGCSAGNDNGPIGNSDSVIVIDESGEELVGDWVLIWSDEFNSNFLDLTKWEYMVGDGTDYGIPGWGNRELQYYLPGNVDVNNGNLVINALGGVGFNDGTDDFNFTSGRLRSTQETSSFTYGRIEARIKLPSEAGLWSAFWMLANNDSPYGSWPSAGEIDIMEFIDSQGPFYTFGTLHFGARNDEKGQIPSSSQHIPYEASDNFKFKAIPENIEPLSSACLEASNGICTKIDPTINPNGFDCLLFGVKTIRQDGIVEYIGQDGSPLDPSERMDETCEIELHRCKFPIDDRGFCQTENPTQDFHIYSIEWDEEEIRWFVDGTHYQTVPASSYWTYGRPSNSPLAPYTSGSESAPFDSPFHLLLNVAVGGDLPADSPDPNLSGEMRVDWVRVYECEKNPLTGLGCKGGKLKDQNGNAINDSPINVNNPYRNFDHYTNLQLPRIRKYDLFDDGFQSLFSGGSQRNIGYLTSQNLDPSSVFDDGETLTVSLSAGSYIDIVDSKVESIETFHLSGMGSASRNGNAEIIFDLKINNINHASNDLKFSMVSSDENDTPTESKPFYLSLDNLTTGVWHRSISIPLNNFLFESSINVERIRSLVRIESENSVNFELDNIQLACGSATDCRIQSLASIEEQIFGSAPFMDPSLPSFGQSRFLADGKNPLWDKPFTAWDNKVGSDYVEPRGNHVTWSLKDIDTNPEDEVTDYVIEVNFGDDATTSGVFYIGASSPIDLSGYRQGSLVMDIKVIDNPFAADINYKVDHCYYGNDEKLYCNQGKGTGEMPLPLDPLISAFQTVRIPFCTLTSRGLDDVMVISPLVIVPGSGGSANNVTLQIDNVYFDHQPVVADCSTILPLNFENQDKIYPVGGFAGGTPTVVPNSVSDTVNASSRVLKIVKGAPEVNGQNWGGAYIDLTESLDFTTSGSSLSMNILAPVSGSTLDVKLEHFISGNSWGEATSESYTVVNANQWLPVTFDFTGKVSNVNDWTRISFIVNNGVPGTGDSYSAFYIDDIEQIDTGNIAFNWSNNATLLDFDIPDTTYVINGWGGATGTVVTDPLDPNNLVGNHTRSFVDIEVLTAGPVLGPFSDPIPVNSSVMYACMDVLSPSDTTYNLIDEDGDEVPPFFRQRDPTTDVTMKLEDATNYYQQVSSSVVIQNTGVWQTLFFDFSTGLGASFPDQPTYTSANGDGSYEKIVLNFEGEKITDLTYHFDNIEFVEDSNLDGFIDINDCTSMSANGGM